MHRSRARGVASRAALVAAFVLSSPVSTVSAASPDVTLSPPTVSPVEVTVGLPVAYSVTINNGSNHALKYVTVSASMPSGFIYLDAASGDGPCGPQQSCNFDGLASGDSATATFYFRAPASPGVFDFTALANFDGQTTESPANFQNTLVASVPTTVLALNADHVAGHSLPDDPSTPWDDRTFTTSGVQPLGSSNRHDTTVRVAENAEVTLRDLSTSQADAFADCTTYVGAACFGEASSVSVAGGATVSSGMRVVMRWDSSDLPKGMTEKKIRIVHIYEDESAESGLAAENVILPCVQPGGPGTTPVLMPCLEGAPIRFSDKDIQATMWWAHNGIGRGW